VVDIFDINDQARIEIQQGPAHVPAIPGTQNIVPGAVLMFQNVTWYTSLEMFVTRPGASSVQVNIEKTVNS
jgi:hypothetical protein